MVSQNKQKKLAHLEVLNHIRIEQPHFSPAQRQVADYVLKYYHQIPFLSISALAENIGVSNNSIIKFCNHLGFAKFAEFKRIFSEHAHSTLTAPTTTKSETSKGEDFLAQNLDEDVQAISNTMNNPINQENLPKAISMIMKARNIYVCGGSRSFPLAQTLALNMQWQRLSAFPVFYQSDCFWMQVRSATPQDLVIILTMPDYSAIAIDAMQRLQNYKVPVLLLTDDGLSPALPHADLTLHCAYYDRYYMMSNIGMHSMVNALCRGINHWQDKEKYHKNKDSK